MHRSEPDIHSRLAAARLPAMPQILLKLMELCQAEETGMADLADLIARDAGMAGKILGAANSSAYHRGNQPVGLEQALMALGTDMVKTLLISESVFQVFNRFSHANDTDLRGFWKHALTAAVSARMIAQKIAYPHAEEAYLAGLLHDVGRLALLAAAPREYAVNFLAQDDDILCAVEQRTLQITHPEAGAWLIQRWNLDSFLADSVLYHHEPAARLENAHPLIRIAYVAHQLAAAAGEPTPDVAALCGLTPADVARIRADAQEQARQAAGYLGIDLDGADELRAAPAASVSPLDPVQARLGEQVRDMVLAGEAGRSFARQNGEAPLLEAVARSARLLFDLGDAVILLHDRARNALIGTSAGAQRQRLAGFTIALAAGGPIAEAAGQRRLTYVDRNHAAPGIAEEQLLRILDAECLVCLPLAAAGDCRGVLVGAAWSWQLPGLRQRAGLLQAFGAQAAAALDAALQGADQADSAAAGIREQYREASRRVAHEVNNPLSIIKNYLSVLDRKLARQEQVNGEISILHEEIDRVGQIVNGLADLQPGAGDGGSTDLNRVVNDVVRLFRDTEFVPPSVRIAAHVQDQRFDIDSDADTLKQIMVNLIKNAVEALPGRGDIEIRNNGFVNREGRLYVELAIRDSGPGLPAEVMANLFSPVRSTKGEGHRGLGLSIVHGLVRKIHGLITCRSNNTGTAFEILLPAHGAQRSAA